MEKQSMNEKKCLSNLQMLFFFPQLIKIFAIDFFVKKKKIHIWTSIKHLQQQRQQWTWVKTAQVTVKWGGCWAEGGGMDASDFYLQLIQPILGGNERLIQVGWPGEQWADGLWGYSTKNEINLHTQQ